MKTLPLGPFKGINTRRPDFALQDEDGSWLRAATNLDIDNAGRLRLRKGLALVQALTAPHSLFKTLAGVFYLVRASVLYRVTLPAYTETLVKILSSNATMNYVEQDGSIYFSNGTDSGLIYGGNVYPWGLATPAQPSVAAIAGSLHAGKYQVGVTYVNSATGEESGHAGTVSHELLASGALRVTLPGASDGATHINVYISRLNGSVAYLHSSVAVGTVTMDITSLAALDRKMREALEEPFPACTSLFYEMGRLCGLAGDKLIYCNPYRLGYWTPTNYVEFETAPTLAISNQNGTYVASSKTQWFAGDIAKPEAITDVLPYGAVQGTAFHHPNKPIVGWFGAEGFVIADAQGQAQAVMADAVTVSASASGYTAVIDDEYRRVISCGWCLNLERMAATQYAGFEITSYAGGYATKADGVFSVGGIEDNGAKIDWLAGLGKQDFGAENLKHLPAVYAGVASAEPIALVVTTPDGDEYEYEARGYSENLMVQRIDPGKGLRENWFDLSLKNLGKSDLTLASVSFAPVVSGRRI